MHLASKANKFQNMQIRRYNYVDNRSNSIVEYGFSHLTAMFSDWQPSVKHSTMENLLLIRLNDTMWKQNERDQFHSTSSEYFSINMIV